MEDGRRRPRAAEGPVVANINPAPARVGFALRQHRDNSVVAVQAFRRHDMGFDQLSQRRQNIAYGADGVRHGGERNRHILARIALGLTIRNPIDWKLVTNLPIDNLAAAVEKLD